MSYQNYFINWQEKKKREREKEERNVLKNVLLIKKQE